MASKDKNTDVEDLKRQRLQAEQQGNPDRVRELDEQIAQAERDNTRR